MQNLWFCTENGPSPAMDMREARTTMSLKLNLIQFLQICYLQICILQKIAIFKLQFLQNSILQFAKLPNFASILKQNLPKIDLWVSSFGTTLGQKWPFLKRSFLAQNGPKTWGPKVNFGPNWSWPTTHQNRSKWPIFWPNLINLDQIWPILPPEGRKSWSPDRRSGPRSEPSLFWRSQNPLTERPGPSSGAAQRG